jgi:YjbE family integral membrane protein
MSIEAFQAFIAVIGIDLVLSGDNAVVIGTAAAGLPAEQRKRAIVIGIVIAAVTRIFFSLIAFYLLQVVGLLLAGGLLLAWVAWTMWRDLSRQAREEKRQALSEALEGGSPAPATGPAKVKTFASALTAIVIADVSMSLDNVLAVAGAARDHLPVLVFWLALSIALMGFAANFLARLMERHRWIAYAGAALVTYVALDMMWRGAAEVEPLIEAAMAASPI